MSEEGLPDIYKFEELCNLCLPRLPEHPNWAPDFLRIRETIGLKLYELPLTPYRSPPAPSDSSSPSSTATYATVTRRSLSSEGRTPVNESPP